MVVDQFSKWVKCNVLSDKAYKRVASTLVSEFMGDLDALLSFTVIRVVTLRVGVQ